MKTGLVVAGVGVLLAAVYFIARRPAVPTLQGKQPSGNLKPPKQNVASSLLTSQNIGSLLTLFGGSAQPAKVGGVGNTGLEGKIVTQADLNRSVQSSDTGLNGAVFSL